jgi:hypothetical protein
LNLSCHLVISGRLRTRQPDGDNAHQQNKPNVRSCLQFHKTLLIEEKKGVFTSLDAQRVAGHREISCGK